MQELLVMAGESHMMCPSERSTTLVSIEPLNRSSALGQGRPWGSCPGTEPQWGWGLVRDPHRTPPQHPPALPGWPCPLGWSHAC